MTVTPDRRDDDTALTKPFELSEGDQEKIDEEHCNRGSCSNLVWRI